jgi:hypothetical protein
MTTLVLPLVTLGGELADTKTSMASTLDTPARFLPREDSPAKAVVAIVAADEFKEAKRDPRVRSFLNEADAYLAALEQEGRNR